MIAAPVLLSARLIPDSHVEALLGAAAVGAVFAELFMIKVRTQASAHGDAFPCAADVDGFASCNQVCHRARRHCLIAHAASNEKPFDGTMLQGLLIFDPEEGDRAHGRDSQTGQLAVPRWNLALVRALAHCVPVKPPAAAAMPMTQCEL